MEELLPPVFSFKGFTEAPVPAPPAASVGGEENATDDEEGGTLVEGGEAGAEGISPAVRGIPKGAFCAGVPVKEEGKNCPEGKP